MSNDILPSEPKSALEIFTEKLNLPQMIAGPAGKAISRLVAGVIDIPAAYLDAFAQSIKDKTAARTTVNKEVAEAAAKLAAGDTDIVARAAHNLLAKEFRKQRNKEEISRKAIEILQEETRSLPPPRPAAANQPPPEVDPDWLNVFERYAEEASSERMQTIWSRILAGEIRKPRTFSLATLRFIAVVDERTATLFQKHAGTVVAGDFIPYPEQSGAPFSEHLELQDAGLLVGVGGTIAKIFKVEQPDAVGFPFKTGIVVARFTNPFEFQIPAVLLTRTGRELFSITQCHENREKIDQFVKSIPKQNCANIIYVKHGVGPEEIWKPEPPPEEKARE